MTQSTSDSGSATTLAERTRLERLERLAHEVMDSIAAVNDGAVDGWALAVATMRLERDMDAVLVILKSGGDRR